MSNWPLFGVGRVETLGAANRAFELTSSGDTNTLSAWAQLGTTSFSYTGLHLQVYATATRLMVDLGVGTSGAERVLVSQLPFESSAAAGMAGNLFLPLAVPEGTGVFARQRCLSASQKGGINVTGIAGEWKTALPAGLAYAELVNSFNTSNTIISSGIATASGSASTDSAWAEITASTTRAYCALSVGISPAGDGSRTLGHAAVDIAVGASGSEVVILSDVATYFEYNRVQNVSFAGPFPLAIPAGVRLAGRCRASTTSTDSHGIALIGVAA